MPSDEVTIQEAFDALTRSQYELMTAFHATTAYLMGWITVGDKDAQAEMAAGLEEQARLVGSERPGDGPDADAPNKHMMVLAQAMRSGTGGVKPHLQLVPKD